MKIEFHPDFKIPLSFKAIWPKLRDAFQGLRLTPTGYGKLMKRVVFVLMFFIIALLIVILLVVVFKT
jgi:hypothetical protein